MSGNDFFDNFSALEQWLSSRFLLPVIVVECSAQVNKAAMRNGVDFVQLLRPFQRCIVPQYLLIRDEERRRIGERFDSQSSSFAVRFTKADCVRSLGSYLTSVADEHLRHLLSLHESCRQGSSRRIGKNEKSSKDASLSSSHFLQEQDGSDLDRVIISSLLRRSDEASDSLKENNEQNTLIMSSSLSEKVEAPSPRPQYVNCGEALTGGVTARSNDLVSGATRKVSQADEGTTDLFSNSAIISELDILVQHSSPPWFRQFSRDYSHLVRCGHVDTIDHPIGIIFCVSTHEGLTPETAAAAGSGWKKVVVQAIRKEIERQYQYVVQRVWGNAVEVDREVHMFFFLINDDFRFALDETSKSEKFFFPLDQEDVSSLLSECQSMTAELSMMRDTSVAKSTTGIADCWALINLNSSLDPLCGVLEQFSDFSSKQMKSDGESGGGEETYISSAIKEPFDPNAWVRANPPFLDVLSEESLKEVESFNHRFLPQAEDQELSKNILQSASWKKHMYRNASRISISFKPAYSTYFIPFPWKKHRVCASHGLWNFEYESTEMLKPGEDTQQEQQLPLLTGCFLSTQNLLDLEGAVKYYFTCQLLPYIKRRITVLSHEIQVKRTTTLGKVVAWFKSDEAKPKREIELVSVLSGGRETGMTVERFRHSSIEMKMRRCAEFCMFLRDFEAAQRNLKMCRDELLESSQNRMLVNPLLGGVQEAISLCQLYLSAQGPPFHPLPSRSTPYSPAFGDQSRSNSRPPFACNSLVNPKCTGVCRLEVAIGDYLLGSDIAGNEGQDKLFSYAMRTCFLLLEMCRLQQHPRPAMEAAAQLLTNMLLTKIPQRSSPVWGALIHQLLAGVYLIMNIPIPLLYVGDVLRTKPSFHLSGEKCGIYSHLRQYVYHLHQAGSYWFSEAVQRPSSVYPALYCYRRLFSCVKPLFHNPNPVGEGKNHHHLYSSRATGLGESSGALHVLSENSHAGWRAMMSDIVGKLLFLLLPQLRSEQRRRQHLPVLASPVASNVVLSPNQGSSTALLVGTVLQDTPQHLLEGLDVVTFAVKHNIRCRINHIDGDEAVLKDIVLLFKLQRECKLVPQMLGCYQKKEKETQLALSEYFISGFMALPMVDSNSIVIEMNYYNVDVSSELATSSAKECFGDLIDKEWRLTEGRLRDYYLQTTQSDASVGVSPNVMYPMSDLPQYTFPPYVGDKCSIPIRLSEPNFFSREKRSKKVGNVNDHVRFAMGCSPSGTTLNAFVSGSPGESITSISEASRTALPRDEHSPHGIGIPPLSFTIPQQQWFWVSFVVVNPLSISLLVKNMCLVYCIEEEELDREVSLIVQGEDIYDEHHSKNRTLHDPHTGTSLRQEHKMKPDDPMPKEAGEGMKIGQIELGPLQKRFIRLPFSTNNFPCGAVQVLGMAWELCLPLPPPNHLVEGRFYFATALRCGSLRTPTTQPVVEVASHSSQGSSGSGEFRLDPMKTEFTPLVSSCRSTSFVHPRDASAVFPIHSFRSFPALLHAVENTRFLVTPARATLCAFFDPPIPERFYDGEIFSTYLCIQNQSKPCGSPCSPEKNNLKKPFHEESEFSTDMVLGSTCALNVTVEVSPHNRFFMYFEGFSVHRGEKEFADNKESVPMDKSAPQTYLVAERINPSETVRVKVSLRARYYSLSYRIPSGEAVYNELMLLIGFIPSSLMHPLYDSPLAVSGLKFPTKEMLDDAGHRHTPFLAHQSSASAGNASVLFPLPPTSVVLHRVHRRVLVEPILFLASFVFPPQNVSEDEEVLSGEEIAVNKKRLSTAASLVVQNIRKASGDPDAIQISRITSTHRPDWEVSRFPYAPEIQENEIPENGALTFALEVSRKPFRARDAPERFPFSSACGLPAPKDHTYTEKELRNQLREEEVKSISLKEVECFSFCQGKDASAALQPSEERSYVASLPSQRFFLTTCAEEVGHLGGTNLATHALVFYRDGGAKKKYHEEVSHFPRSVDGAANGAMANKETKKHGSDGDMSEQSAHGGSALDETEEALAVEAETYGRPLEQYTPIALSVEWVLKGSSKTDPSDTSRSEPRRGSMYHFFDPLNFFTFVQGSFRDTTADSSPTSMAEEDMLKKNYEDNRGSVSFREMQRYMCHLLIRQSPYSMDFCTKYRGGLKGWIAFNTKVFCESNMGENKPFVLLLNPSRNSDKALAYPIRNIQRKPHSSDFLAEACGTAVVQVTVRSLAPIPVLAHILGHHITALKPVYSLHCKDNEKRIKECVFYTFSGKRGSSNIKETAFEENSCFYKCSHDSVDGRSVSCFSSFVLLPGETVTSSFQLPFRLLLKKSEAFSFLVPNKLGSCQRVRLKINSFSLEASTLRFSTGMKSGMSQGALVKELLKDETIKNVGSSTRNQENSGNGCLNGKEDASSDEAKSVLRRWCPLSCPSSQLVIKPTSDCFTSICIKLEDSFDSRTSEVVNSQSFNKSIDDSWRRARNILRLEKSI